MRKIWIPIVLLLLAIGCASKIEVVTLADALQDSACVVKKSLGDAATKTTITLTVVNGYEASGTTPVVPIGIKTTVSQSQSVAVEIDLKKLQAPCSDVAAQGASKAPRRKYLLNTQTGALEPK